MAKPKGCKYPDCLNCIFDDCIYDDLEPEDIEEGNNFDKTISDERELQKKFNDGTADKYLKTQEYNKSKNGRERTERYNRSEKRKISQKKYYEKHKDTILEKAREKRKDMKSVKNHMKDCINCKYYKLDHTEEPCKSCKYNYTDNFQPAKNVRYIDMMEEMEILEIIQFLHKHADCSKCSADKCNADMCVDKLINKLNSEVQYEETRVLRNKKRIGA